MTVGKRHNVDRPWEFDLAAQIFVHHNGLVQHLLFDRGHPKLPVYLDLHLPATCEHDHKILELPGLGQLHQVKGRRKEDSIFYNVFINVHCSF